MGDHRGGGTPKLKAASIPSILWYLCSHQLLYPFVLPTRSTHTLLWGKLRPRPHSKFPGLKLALGLPPTLPSQLPAATWMEASRRPGRGIPRAQAAFQQARPRLL